MTLQEFLEEWKSDKSWMEVYTSGSTGVPKRMRAEKQKMWNSARITCDFLGLQPGDTALLCMPLDYIAGKMMVVRCLERKMHLIPIEPSGHPMSFFLRDQQHLKVPDFAAMVPLQVYNSLQIPEEADLLRKVKVLLIGGGSIDEALERELRNFPHAVWSTYGMTETLSHIALRRLNGPKASSWYVPFDGVGIGKDQEGCLVIDAPLVHDGVLVTNDRVELRLTEREGKRPITEFRILGRKDNVIDSGGIKIQIEEVEQKLKSVLDQPYLITKRRDEKFGEEVVLLTQQTDLPQVRALCKKVLPRYWQPKFYLYVKQIPLTETGKPARAEAERLVSRGESRP